MNYTNILESIKQRKVATNEKIDICIITNIGLQPLFTTLLVNEFSKNYILANIEIIEYESVFEAKNSNSFKNADIVLIWLDLGYFYPKANDSYFLDKSGERALNDMDKLFDALIKHVKKSSKAEIIWISFTGFSSQLTFVLGHMVNEFILKSNLILCKLQSMHLIRLINIEHLIAEIGSKKAFNNKNLWRWNSPFTGELYNIVSAEIFKQYIIEKGVTKKCLILDCDNVLWGGILSEDGIENIKLGSSGFGCAYQDFQRFLLSLYHHGVILAICSKNDLSDVMTVFRTHSEMVLKESHIACFQVNWNDKPTNIKKIAELLNIGFDSMVFVDDSQIEIEAVKAMLPEVTSILYNRDTIYNQLSCFNLRSNINMDDVKKRYETYQTNQSREELKAQYDTYDEYIEALEIKLDIHEAMPIEFNRISELTQRTNKCTNGKRYTVAELEERVHVLGTTLYSLSASDRFSDLGLVGAVEVEGDTLTLFSLSCRALGREIEKKMLMFIANKHQIKKVNFYSTGKNEGTKLLLLQTFANATLNITISKV